MIEMKRDEILIHCKEGDTYFMKQLLYFCPIWDQVFENEQTIVDLDINVSLIRQIEKFFALHNFDSSKIVCQNPIQSNNLIENIDEISYRFMKEDLNWNDNIENKEQYIEYAKELNPILSFTYRLNCQILQNVILTALATPFYLGGDNEESFKLFAVKWGTTYPITAIKQKSIVEENRVLFDTLDKKIKQSYSKN